MMFNRSELAGWDRDTYKRSKQERDSLCFISSDLFHMQGEDVEEQQRREAVSERWMPRAADPSESLSSLSAHSGDGAATTQAIKYMESQHSCVHAEKHPDGH